MELTINLVIFAILAFVVINKTISPLVASILFIALALITKTVLSVADNAGLPQFFDPKFLAMIIFGFLVLWAYLKVLAFLSNAYGILVGIVILVFGWFGYTYGFVPGVAYVIKAIFG